MAILMAGSTAYELLVTEYMQVPSEFWFRLYSLLEFFAVSLFFLWELPRKYSRVVIGCMGFFFMLWLAVTITLPLNYGTDNYVNLPQTFLTFAYIFLWFSDLFSKAEESALWQRPGFYFVVAITLYQAATLFLFLLSQTMMERKDISVEDYWIINVVAVLLTRIIISFSVWKAAR